MGIYIWNNTQSKLHLYHARQRCSAWTNITMGDKIENQSLKDLLLNAIIPLPSTQRLSRVICPIACLIGGFPITRAALARAGFSRYAMAPHRIGHSRKGPISPWYGFNAREVIVGEIWQSASSSLGDRIRDLLFTSTCSSASAWYSIHHPSDVGTYVRFTQWKAQVS